MDDLSSFLLQVYRAARECAPDAFQGEVLDRLRASFAFASAFWGAARIDGGVGVPTTVHTTNIDPSFLSDWARHVAVDPIVPYLLSTPGRALPVKVPLTWAASPEVIDTAARYRMQSMTVISSPHSIRLPLQRSAEWITLFRERPDAICTATEQRWLEAVTPHLTEAWRINRALHGTDDDDFSGPGVGVAVADADNGALLCADDAFRAALAGEWSGFDGRHVPMPLRHQWAGGRRRFTRVGRHTCIEGRCAGKMVYLSAQPKAAATQALTARQLEIAELFVQDLSSKQVAKRCGLSPATVRSHLASVYAALDVHSKLELANRLAGRR